MLVCQNCKKETPDEGKNCLHCGASIEEMPLNATGDGEKKQEKKNWKNQIAKSGKKIVSFGIEEIISCIISAILSACLVLFTQSAFKDNVQDYRIFYREDIKPLSQELLAHVQKVGEMEAGEFAEYCKANRVFEKSTELLKVLHSYSSDDPDIRTLHTHMISICEEVYDLSILAYSSSYTNADISDDIYTAVFRIKSKVNIFNDVKAEIYEKHGIVDTE